MARSLRDRVVVITGASAGIGRAAALAFAREGSRVVIAARRPDRLSAVQAEVECAGARCLAVPTDVSDRAQVQRLLDATIEHFGRVDLWVNNAGSGLVGSVEQTTPEEARALMETNFMGALHGCQVALQQMRRQGSGQLINVSSLAARFPLPLHGVYTATKYALNGLTEALALELAGSGIEISLIMPGVTETEFGAAAIRKIPDARPLKTPCDSPEKVARRVVRCARRPRAQVMFLPGARLTLALFDLMPGIWRAVARRYIRYRTAGRGIPAPGDQAVDGE